MNRDDAHRKTQNGRPWRSLEQLADDPRSRAFAEREFPEGITEPPTGVTRRTMLSLIGASLSMAGLAGCRRPVEKIVPFVNAPENMVPGIPKHYATTMPTGLGGIGLVVENHEGRPTKVEGNAMHPASGGASGSWVQASILGLYDSDRSQTVLRDGTPSDWAAFVTAWGELAADHATDGGARLALLAESFSSPTLFRLARAFRERYPQARWVTYDCVSDENIHGGIAEACGTAMRPLYNFERASTILSIDSDFLLTESESVRHARGFAAGRRVGPGAGPMNRLYAVEACRSLTGSNADHRMRLNSDRIPVFTAALAAALRRKGLQVDLPSSLQNAAVEGLDTHWIDVLAGDLMAHRGTGLILAGRRQPAAVHAAVFALNAALGNSGTTVDYEGFPDATPLPDRAPLGALVESMRNGEIDTLALLGGNPVFDMPADLEFATALSNVPHVIQLGNTVDETARMAHWHVPRAHYLESWADVRAAGGARSVVQPMVQPLFGGKSEVEFLGLLANGDDIPGYDRVRETWSALLGDTGFERAWHEVLHDGLWKADDDAPSAPPTPLSTVFDSLARHLASSGANEGMELVFQASPAVFDGRWANNAWLQELPDAVTKLTWDNAALVSAATAEAVGLSNEQMVRLSYRGRETEMPVWIVPGQADETVVVSLGYGRAGAGRVGDGVGVDVNALRTADAPDFGRGLSLVATGETYALAQTQDHGSMTEPTLPGWEGKQRPLVRYATRDKYDAHPEFAQDMVEVPHGKSMWKSFEYTEGNQWGMSIDLNACTGCNACVIACQSENNIPAVGKEQVRNGREMHWLRVDRYFEGDTDDPETFFQPVPCMHCENAPCEQVCPVSATVHDDEGLNVMVYNRCIGTRYCSNNCPYKVRRFNYFNYTKDTPEILQMAANPDVTVRSRGVMEKCTYCTQRINASKIDAKLAGREVADGDVQTACQQACPSQAIRFGNVLDTESEVARAKAGPRNYTLLEETFTRPRTSFLAKIQNPNPALAPSQSEEEGSHG